MEHRTFQPLVTLATKPNAEIYNPIKYIVIRRIFPNGATSLGVSSHDGSSPHGGSHNNTISARGFQVWVNNTNIIQIIFDTYMDFTFKLVVII